MFNAEQLLGKVVGGMLGSHGKSHGSGSLLGNLASGAGLMTVIGLGVGAYEHFAEKQKTQGQQGGPPPPPAQPGMTPPPPPGVVGSVSQPSPLPAQATMWTKPAPPPPSTQDLAIRMIRVMIAAAHADGIMDEKEEEVILTRLREAGLTQEERIFIVSEMHAPKSIDELVDGMTDPAVAKTMYALAAGAITIDTENERAWLDQLAARLGLSKAVQAFLEE